MIDFIRRKLYLFLLFVAYGIQLSYGQSLSVQASIDKSEILTGQQANILLKIRTNDIANTKIYNSKTEDDKSFQILDYIPIDTIDVDGVEKELNVNVLVTSFDSTIVKISPFIVKTKSDSVVSQSLSLKVVQPDVDIANKDVIAPSKGLWDIKLTFWDYIKLIFTSVYFYLAIALILLLVGLRYIYKKMKNRPKPIEKEPEIVLTPIEKAIRDFELLDKSEYIYKGDYKQYYTMRFDIVRVYLEDKLHWNALEMTNDEILKSFNKHFGKEEKLMSKIKDIVSESDLVKFAKYKPLSNDVEYFKTNTYKCCEMIEEIVSIENEI